MLHTMNIVAAFWEMNVSPGKHSYAWLPRKCDYQTDRYMDRQTDAGQSDHYVPLCFAGDTKIQHSSNCIPFSEYCKIAIPTNAITVQANNITISKLPLGRFSHGHALVCLRITFYKVTAITKYCMMWYRCTNKSCQMTTILAGWQPSLKVAWTSALKCSYSLISYFLRIWITFSWSLR